MVQLADLKLRMIIAVIILTEWGCNLLRETRDKLFHGESSDTC